MDDFFASQVADLDEVVARLDAAADVDTFARELAGLIENASSRITVPVMVDGQELVVRTVQGSYRLRVTRVDP